MRRGFHRHQSKQLEHVFLHHVTQGACFIVEAAASLEAHGFGDSDLNMFDTSRVPQLLEQPVAKAKRQQILYRFLAEIVVYSERPLLGESSEHSVIDAVKGREGLTKRLLKPNARLCAGQSGRLKPGDGRLEQ